MTKNIRRPGIKIVKPVSNGILILRKEIISFFHSASRKPQVTSLARANVCSVETGSKSFNNHRFKPNIKHWFTVPRKLQDLWSTNENKMFKIFNIKKLPRLVNVCL